MRYILFIMLCSAANVSQAQSEDIAVKATLLDYLEGGTLGDTVRLNRAFDKSASMRFVDNKTGEYRIVPIVEFLDRAKANAGKKSDRKTRIIYMHVAGTAAQARLEIDGGTYFFHDFMNLLKINGQWKIVSKIFWREEKL